jgi:hypothetical protein
MSNRTISKVLPRNQQSDKASLSLDNDSRVTVIGGGPAGSFFSYFLMDMA